MTQRKCKAEANKKKKNMEKERQREKEREREGVGDAIEVAKGEEDDITFTYCPGFCDDSRYL